MTTIVARFQDHTPLVLSGDLLDGVDHHQVELGPRIRRRRIEWGRFRLGVFPFPKWPHRNHRRQNTRMLPVLPLSRLQRCSGGRGTGQDGPSALRRPGSCAVFFSQASGPLQSLEAPHRVSPAIVKPGNPRFSAILAIFGHFCGLRPSRQLNPSRQSGGRGLAEFRSAGHRWPAVRRISPAAATKGVESVPQQW